MCIAHFPYYRSNDDWALGTERYRITSDSQVKIYALSAKIYVKSSAIKYNVNYVRLRQKKLVLYFSANVKTTQESLTKIH